MQRIITVMHQEACRKIIHCLIVFVPFIAGYSYSLAYFLLSCGIALYSWSEYQRLAGRYVPVLSHIKEKAFRTRDMDHFAKYSLAFGDTAACLVGKSMGKTRIPYTGKTLEGSMACFATVFALAFHATGCDIVKTSAAALAATLTELLPVKDYDNLLIPLVTGLMLTVL